MSVLNDRLRRYWRTFKKAAAGNLSVWLPAVAVVVAVVTVLGLAFSAPSGTYRYCSDMLARCIKDIPADAGGGVKMKTVAACSFQTARCDIETLHFYLTHKDELSVSAAAKIETDEKRDAEVMQRLLSEDLRRERTAEVIREEEFEAERTETTEDLNAEMERLRREREVFEAEQARFKKMLYEMTVRGTDKETVFEKHDLTRQTEK